MNDQMNPTPTLWLVYMVRCRDGSLYTGITTDIRRRIHEHNTGTGGAKYTRGRRPVTLVYTESFSTRSQASIREYTIKKMQTSKKHQLIHSRELEIGAQ